MSKSALTPEIREAIVTRIVAGATLVEAAQACAIRPETARGWLTRGRREDHGPHSDFAHAVDAARARPVQHAAVHGGGPMSLEELELVVAKAARAGSVPAMRLMLELLRDRARARATPVTPDPFGWIDQLAKRRADKPRPA